MFSPTSATVSSRPLTTSSAASESSSLGSIPDFPVPQPPMPTIQPLPRRTPSLGPPPSSRRGPSSYYTQMSYVSPIVEESDTRSDIIRSHHGSFASSMAIPANSDDYYLEDDDMQSDDDDTIRSGYGRSSRGSDHDDHSELVQPALLRQASLGRRTKPSIMTIKSVDSLGEKKGIVIRKPISDAGANASAAGIGGAMLAARDGISGRESPILRNMPPAGGSAFFESSSSESLRSLRNVKSRFDDEESQRVMDPEKEMLELIETPVHPLQQSMPQGKLSERVGMRRPPRLDVDAVRDAEARGSLTSLPELIRRATRLAANLDRGKTASQLGLNFWESGAQEKNKLDARRSGSVSDLLAAFPRPGEATPTGERTPRPNRDLKSVWPGSGARGYSTGSTNRDSQGKRRRRCCGMPMWTFVTLLIVLLFLVAAAVVIPIVLIVIPKMKNTTNNTAQNNAGTGTATPSNIPPVAAPTSTSGSNQCNGVITCQNNGVAILNSDRSCNCVCINGFTGTTCGTQADAGCTTADIGATNNATVGTGIPRLIESAMNNFSIPLDASSLLSLFSSLSLSCTSENALVTFNGLASRSIPLAHLPILMDRIPEPSRTLPILDMSRSERAPRTLRQRQTVGEPGVAQPNKAAVASTSATTQASSTPTQPVSSNATAIDFARVGVLLALQESRMLDTAAKAQESLQDFLTNNRNGNSNGNTVDMGPFTMDLVNFSIKFRNGTTIQATAPAATTE